MENNVENYQWGRGIFRNPPSPLIVTSSYAGSRLGIPAVRQGCLPVLLLLSSCNMKILSFCKEEFFICRPRIALIGTDIFSVFGFSAILTVFQSVCETLRDRLSFVNMKWDQTCHCHSSVCLPPKRKSRRLAAPPNIYSFCLLFKIR